MDRRKLGARNALLHRPGLGSSQLSISRSSVPDSLKENSIVRSASDDPVARKRAKSSDDEDEQQQPESVKLSNVRKKRRNIVPDEDEEDEQELGGDKAQDDFAKPTSKTNDLEPDNNDDYIMGMLQALDKSPAKLSQNTSSSSVNKYRKLNLRTPVHVKKAAPRTIAERRNKAKEEQLASQSDPRINRPGPASKYTQKEKQNVGKEEKEIQKRKEDAKQKKPQDSGKKNTNEATSDEEMFSSDTGSCRPPKKITAEDEGKDESSDESSIGSKARDSSVVAHKTPEKATRNRVLESPELSPLRSFHSPEKINVNTRRQKTQKLNNDKFISFLNQVGVTLSTGEGLHVASKDPREIIQKMKELLSSKKFNKDEVIEFWNKHIEDNENLRKILCEMTIETESGLTVSSKAVSLSRLLLQVPQLQIEIINSLIQKLIDAVITAESSDDAPWALQMLQQFRFLEITVDPDVLINKIEELLSSSPEWFQREVIVFIPDIVTDTQHHTTAEMLTIIMEKNGDLTNIILDCIYNLILGKEYREELRNKILELLTTKFDKSNVAAITRFLLTACPTEVVALKCLNAIRVIDMAPVEYRKKNEIYTHQTFMVNALKTSIHLFKEVTQAAVTLIKTPVAEAVALDIIISMILFELSPAKRKIVEATLHGHIKDGYYKTSLLNILYTGYKQVARSFQPAASNLAINLLKTENPSLVEFGIEWLRNIFISQSDTPYKQREIMEKILNLMGNKDKTVKNALEVLCRLANNETERIFLQQHAGFLRSFLEKIDNLQFDEVSILYHLLHGLCTHSEVISNILYDDLSIIMQKQLCSSKVVTKCKGVLGAVMAIKHLAGSDETSSEGFELLKKTLCSLKSCIRSQALFHDQLGNIILNSKSNDSITESFLSDITNYFEDIFINNCLVDEKPNGHLVPKFGLNDPSLAESYYVNFGSGKAGASVPVFLKLLRICNLRLSGSLESINAVLGCPILMPEDLDMPETSTADYMIHCINWFRELIGGFVTQEEALLREQVLKRLDSLMTLQGEFVVMMAMLEVQYQPPPCYFHYFPTPQFVRIDMKVKKGGKRGRKKGKNTKEKERDKEDNEDRDDNDETQDRDNTTVHKSIVLPEWENWEMGSVMTAKNPAFFRQMDTKIINLLVEEMQLDSTESSPLDITIPQVCFIIKELLNMFQHQASENFVQDLIVLLPKICTKLKTIINDLRKKDSAHEKEALRLFLCLLVTIFSWKEFQSAKYNTLLRDGLRALAGMSNESNATLRSCRDLVAESYKYFESLADIATQISLAVALVNMCGCLTKHSNSFMIQSKDRQAKMAYGFLCLEWNESHGQQYKAAVKELLKIWIDNETDPLRTVSSVMTWLPEQVFSLDRPQSRLARMPAVTKVNFHLLLKQLYVGLIKGVGVSIETAESDPERIRSWLEAAVCLENTAQICKSNKNTIYLVLFLRYISILYQMLLTSGMKLLEANVKYQPDEVLNVIKSFQRSGRFLRDIFCSARKDKNTALLKLIPVAKSRREKFIYRVKGMLTANNSIGAFWMGNLLNRDLDGEEIESEASENLTTESDMANEDNTDVGSEIFNSDSEDNEDGVED